jgi:allophanate hydrolase subunit 1
MGDRSLLVELGETIAPDVNRRVQELMLQLQQARLPGVREFAPGYRSLLVVFDPLTLSPSELKARITEVAGRPASAGLPQASCSPCRSFTAENTVRTWRGWPATSVSQRTR